MEPNGLPLRIQTYMQLMRIDKPIGTWLLLWPTLWALWISSQGAPEPLVVVIFVLGTFLMRSAGCVINDYADRNFDGYVERTRQRPLVSGSMTPKEALMLAAVLVILAGLLLLQLNTLVWWFALPALLVTGSYPLAKRFFPIPQVYLGLAFSFGIPMAFAALTNSVPRLAWALMLASGCWTMAYDTIYAICDKPDDLKIGIKTAAITLGQYDVIGVMLFHAAFIACMLAIGWQLQLNWPYYLGLLAAIGLIGKQYFDIRGRDRTACFKAFLDNNKVGGAIWLGLLAHYWALKY